MCPLRNPAELWLWFLLNLAKPFWVSGKIAFNDFQYLVADALIANAVSIPPSKFPFNPAPRAAFQQVVSFSRPLSIKLVFTKTSSTNLNHLSPNLLSWLTHSNRHIAQHGRMSDVAGITVSLNV